MKFTKGCLRLLTVLITLCVITACLPLTALAESGVTKWNGSRTISEHIYVKKPIEITGTGIIDVTGFYGIIRSQFYYQDNTPMITIKSGANIAFKNVYIGGVYWGDEAEENEDKESRSSLIYVEPGARLSLYNVDVFGNDNVASHTTQGGAILNEGILGLDDGCNISYCSADVGGGIYNGENATLYMFGDSTVKKCQATLLGGGIANYGYAECNNSSIRECNVATEEVVSTGGGGLYNEGSASLSAFTIESCTVVSDIGSLKTGFGGGIYNDNGGSLHLYDGCVVNKCMAMNGGGIASVSGSLDNAPGNVTIEDTKITYNEAYDGGGIFFRNFFSTNENPPAVLTVGKAIKSSSDAYVYIENNEARCGAGISIHGNTEGSLLHKVYVNDNDGCQGAGVYMDTYLSGYDDDEATYVTNYPGATLTMTSYTHIEGNRDDGYWGREVYSSFGVFVGSRSTLKLKGLPVIKENNSRYMMNYALGDLYGSEAAIVVESPYCYALNVTDSNPSYRYSGMVELLDPEELPLTQEGYEPISLERWRHAYSGVEPYETDYFGTRLNGVVLTGYQNLGLESEELQTYFTGYCNNDTDTDPKGEYLMFTDRENNTVQTGHPASITVICGDQQYNAKVNPSGFYLESTVHIPGKVQTGWQIGDKIYGVNDAMTADISTVTEVIGIYEDKVYTITFHSNSYDSPNWTASVPIRYGETVTLNPNTGGLYKNNATLDGWSTYSYSHTAEYELGDTFTLTKEGNVDLYAHWDHLNVTYVFTGIHGCDELMDTVDGGNLATNVTKDYEITFNSVDEALGWSFPEPYKTGYNFLYWECRGLHFDAGDALDEQQVGGNDTYFVFEAVFEPITTSVNYRHGNGVELSKESQQVVFGEEYQFPSAEELIVSNPDPDYAYYFTYYYLVIDGEYQEFYPGDVVTVDWVEPAEVRPIFGQYSAYFQITVPLEAELDDKTLGFWVGTEAPQLSATATMEGYDQLGWRFTNVPGLESTIFPANYRFTTEEEAYQLICDYIISQDIRDRKGCPLSITAVMLAQDGIPFTAQAYVQNQSGEYEKVNGASLELFGITDRYTEGESYADQLLALIPNGENYVFSHAEDVAVAYDGSSVCNVYFGFKRTYTVEHYLQNTKDDEYTIVAGDTQTLYGTQTTEAVANAYDGFTAQPIEQLEIAEDGSTVVKVYYTRNVYTIQVNLDGGTLEGAQDIQVRYQGLFYLPQGTPVKAGYTFSGWAMYLDGKYTATFEGEDIAYALSLNNIPEESAEARALWTPRAVSQLTLSVTHQTYQVGDQFIPFNATVTYDNGDVETAPITAEMLSGFSTEALAENQVVTVTVGGKTATFTLTVTPKTYTVTFLIGEGEGSAPQSVTLAAGQTFTPPAAEGFSKNGYTFAYWQADETGIIYRTDKTYEMPETDMTLRAVWSLNDPVLSGNTDAFTFYYDGNQHTVSVTGRHQLGDDVTISYRWYKLKAGQSPIPSLAFSIDLLFESRCDLLEETTGTYGFTDLSESGTYYCVVTATHGDYISQTAAQIVVTVNKTLPTKELTQTEFTYTPNGAIDFNDYVVGEGGMETFEVVDKNGLAFDFGDTTAILSNITKAGGTFTLKMTVYETETYAAITKTYTITLNKAKQNPYVSTSNSYPTFLQTVTLTVSNHKGELSYQLISGNATVTGNQIIPNAAGVVEYSVTSAATDLYEEATNTYSITFKKAAGNLAPDYQKPDGYTICIDHTSEDIQLPKGWRWNGTHQFNQVIMGQFSAIFTSENENYEPYTQSLSVSVTKHQKGLPASCSAPCICTLCEKVLEPATSHDYSYTGNHYLRTQGANCMEKNTYWYSCSFCGANAGLDANATDKWYVGTQTGNHNMLADWTSENGQHYHKCSVTGCTHKEDLANCSGGKATCQTRANCSVCGEAYGSVGGHEYDTSVYGYQDDVGHAHKCLYCDAHDTKQVHIPNVTQPTEEVAQYCVADGCGYIMQQQLNHTHTPSNSWEYDSQYHWHDCVANDGQQFNKAGHTFDNNCDTTCNGGCGYLRTVTHDYTLLQFDEYEHWYVCQQCFAEKPGSRVQHSGGHATCQQVATCSICFTVYGQIGDHVYDYTQWVSMDDTYHGRKCTLCEAYSDYTQHTPNGKLSCTEDNLCTACGHMVEKSHGHSYVLAIETEEYLCQRAKDCMSCDTYYLACEYCRVSSKGDTNATFGTERFGDHQMDTAWTCEEDMHYHKCLTPGCDYREDEGQCHGGQRDCQNKAICEICQNPYGQLGEDLWSNEWDYKEENGHAHRCILSGCNNHSDLQPHNPNLPAPTQTQDRICTDCGYVMAVKTGESGDSAVENAINLINGLPEEIKEEDAAAIQTAREAYNALTGEQQQKVSNYQKLEDAEKALAALQQPEKPHYGDVNGDGKVDAKDALVVLKFAVGKAQLTEEEQLTAEVDGKEGVNAKDALEILKYAVDKIDLFPIEKQK